MSSLDRRQMAWLDQLSELYEAHELGEGPRHIGEIVERIIARMKLQGCYKPEAAATIGSGAIPRQRVAQPMK